MFEIVAKTLSFFYELVPDYAVAIGLLTLAVMIVTTPFTLKGTRSMIQMQRLQPEMRKLQIKYKDDRQKLNEELMAFYKENQLNPLGGCLPLLLQAPIFLILFRVVSGLTSTNDAGEFAPKYLDEGSHLFRSLVGDTKMVSFGVDLSESASKALGEGFVHGLPHLALVAIVALSSYYQQRQIAGRNPNAAANPQQQMITKIMPFIFVPITISIPAGVVIYFVVSNLVRIGQQALVTKLEFGEGGSQAAIVTPTPSSPVPKSGGAVKTSGRTTSSSAQVARNRSNKKKKRK
jgi:YidC/Oxa1 family membrane protein insertase